MRVVICWGYVRLAAVCVVRLGVCTYGCGECVHAVGVWKATVCGAGVCGEAEGMYAWLHYVVMLSTCMEGYSLDLNTNLKI